MKGWRKVLTAAVLGLAVAATSGAAEAATLKALIVNGQNNHGWQISSPILKQMLEQSGMFEVDVATSPPKGGAMEGFKPNFAEYDVVVLDYNGELWPEATRKAFVDYVSSGGGVVVYHAANNSFPEWPEYNEIIGLGGWGKRDEKAGPYVRWRDGKAVRDMSPGRGGSHGPRHAFEVIMRNGGHPITKGLPEKWMHAEDELYSELRGPAKNLTVLATAYADPAQKGTGEHEPILFTVGYGKGRVFHTALGHVGRGGGSLPAMECAGFITTLLRGAEWAATGRVTQKVPEDFPTATEVRRWKDYKQPRPLDELLSAVARYEYGQSRQPLSELSDLVGSTYDSAEARKGIEKRLVEFLRSEATPAGKQFICKELSIIGTDECVGALASMLTEKATSEIEPADMARYALERIPGPAADKALRDALDKTGGKVKVGIINSLGGRGDSSAAGQLGGLVSDADKEIAAAAISALGKIGGREAARVLGRAGATAGTGLNAVWADACLACADKFLADGDRSWAIRVYRRMYGPGMASPVRAAALRGMVKTMPERAATIVVGILKGGQDEQMRAVAAGLLREIDSPAPLKAATEEFSSLPVVGQVGVLSALGGRGDRSGLDTVGNATKSNEADVRIAAFGALAVLGDASSVDLLAQAAASTEGAEQQAAREALYRLRGSGVDEKIVASIPRAAAEIEIELIRSIGQRNMSAGVETLLKTAQSPQEQVRLESLKMLRVVAGERDLPALIDLLVKAQSEAERSEAENTVAGVARKIGDKERQAEPILAVLPSIEAVPARCALLGVLGKIGGRGAVLALSKALRDGDAEVRISAVRALSEWPGPEPIEDLRGVATRSTDERERVLALRGFVRLIGLDSERPAEEQVGMYKEAMNLASNVTEKKAVLSGLANVKSFAALQMAAEFLDESGLQQEAEAAVVRIGESTQASHAQQTKAALEKVGQLSRNDSLRQQAQKLIEQIEKYEDYIAQWEVSGPYTKVNAGAQELFDVVFLPEEGDGEKAQWRIMPAGTDVERPWLMELDKAVGGEYCAGYLRTKVWSPKEERARLQVGSNDGIKVWLNGDVVHSNNVLRAVSRDEDIAEVTLREGWNVLMMKITQSRGEWSACARFVGLDGGKLEGLKVSPGDAAKGEAEIRLIGDDFSMWREQTGTWQIVGEAIMSPENEKLLATKAGTGVIVNGPTGRTVDLFSRAEFGDVRAHIEFVVPRGSNSGVYFMARYEIQVLDSYGVERPEYSDCGGIYQRWDEKRTPKGYEGHPPRVNASLPPGQWQSFDVIFRAPRFDESGKKIANARFEKVIHNGIVVQENVEVTGPTRAAAYKDEKPSGPLMLQGDHGPVACRNIRILRLDKGQP
ncbi:MAG TPA: family 16 glycoside hydrolase [Sedimentisphaerales bacterium]|nr:family 16 glycoside hydrolase [Sedimentisphaerales bacterium]